MKPNAKNEKRKIKVILVIVTIIVILSSMGIFKFVQVKKVQAMERERQISLEEERIRQEEEAKKKAEEEERIRKEEEAKRIAEEEAKKKAEEEKIAAEKAKKDQEAKNKQQVTTDVSVLKSNISIKERIEKYLGSDINKFALVYYDLTTGKKISINENKVFTAASTYKLGMNMIAYEEIRKGNLSLNEGIAYNPDKDFEGGTGILQGQITTTLSKPVPVSKLLELSITHSDNIATRMLNRKLGGSSSIRQRMNSMVGLNCETSSNKTTAEIQFRLLKKVYENRGDKYYSQLIKNLKSTIFHDRLDKYIPSNKVAHKIGNYGAAVNDIGIVFTDRPYIISIYSEGLSGASEKIAKISEMIYNEQIK